MGKMVFVGTRRFSLNPFITAKRSVSDFEAVCSLDALDQLQYIGAPDFTYVLAARVTNYAEVEKMRVCVFYEAVRWVACFPVTRNQEGKYVLQTHIPSDSEGVFFFFASPLVIGTPIQAVPDLSGLKLAVPRQGDKLALVRAKNWRWDEKRDTVFVSLKSIIELEIVSRSKARVF